MYLKIRFIVLFILFFNAIFAQDKMPTVDKSPLDFSYCPANYPSLKIQNKNTDPLIARVIYSRPSLNNRKIFGEMLPFGDLWRIGANEATEIEFFKDVYINKVKIKKGRYSLYVIPFENKWTVVINKELDTWGAFNYSVKKDVYRIDLPLEILPTATEALTIYFEKNAAYFNMIMSWENVKAVLPISINK
jgi:hypothetical protein